MTWSLTKSHSDILEAYRLGLKDEDLSNEKTHASRLPQSRIKTFKDPNDSDSTIN